MPVESQVSPEIAAALAHRVGKGGDAARLADTVVSMCREIDAALGPVIGQMGVAALYKRTLHIVCPAHPWLSGVQKGAPTAIDFAALKSVLAKQNNAEASAAGAALLQTFHDLLGTLIGSSLTERLLGSVWANSSSGPPPQDSRR